jgi:hypothetical protein
MRVSIRIRVTRLATWQVRLRGYGLRASDLLEAPWFARDRAWFRDDSLRVNLWGFALWEGPGQAQLRNDVLCVSGRFLGNP